MFFTMRIILVLSLIIFLSCSIASRDDRTAFTANCFEILQQQISCDDFHCNSDKDGLHRPTEWRTGIYDTTENVCRKKQSILFVTLVKKASVTFKCNITLKPNVGVIWSFKNYSDGKEVDIRGSLNNGMWMVTLNSSSAIVQYVDNSSSPLSFWSELSCRPNSTLKSDKKHKLTWKIDVFGNKKHNKTWNETDYDIYHFFNEEFYRKDGVLRSCVIIKISSIWLRSIVLLHYQPAPNFNDSEDAEDNYLLESWLLEPKFDKLNISKQHEYRLCADHYIPVFDIPPILYYNYTIFPVMKPTMSLTRTFKFHISPEVSMSLVTESSWVETTTVQDMFLSLRKTMVLFFLLFGFVIAVTGIVLFARCRLHSVKNESFKLNKFLVRKRVVISATSSENPCYLSSQGSVQSQIDLPNHEFVPPEITIESIDQTAATTSLVSNSQYEIPLDAVWEIPRERVTISSEVLGKGEFGLVMVARVKKGSKVIRSAAKTLKESATDEDLQMLLSELLILKYVNKTPHPNIIRLVGCCTQGKMQPIYVLTERASKGSLIGILESCRDAIASNIPPLVASRNHLLNFALQIANGICHLKKLQVVHRDLACRNILVSSDFTMKIADFGLTRRTANTYYCHNKEARFPFRWLAPESLQRMKFNFASDIWSFGVVMWEIFTLGKVPYEKTSDCSAALLDQLSKGWRLPSPAGISKELYAAMLWCWEWEAELRPTPEEINEKLLAVQKVWDKEFIKIVLSVGLEDWGGTAPLVLTPSP